MDKMAIHAYAEPQTSYGFKEIELKSMKIQCKCLQLCNHFLSFDNRKDSLPCLPGVACNHGDIM